MKRTQLVIALLALGAVAGASGAAAAGEGFDRDERDRTAPELRIWATPDRLSLPNERLRRISISGEAEDDDEIAEVYLASVTSDERGLSADVEGAEIGTFDQELFLRAEDSIGENGRTYRITYVAVDAAGNRASASATVVVAADRDGEAAASGARLRAGA